jgi:hypothetical protein
MKKIAVFVEGQTEQVFATELVRHIFGHAKVDVETFQFSGKTGARKINIIQSVNIFPQTSYYFRIYDCHGGGENSTVRSDIIEQASSLQNQSFSCIIGIRDVYPLLDAIKLKDMINNGFENYKTPIKIFLAIREIESWFLSEELHYQLVNPSLTVPVVNSIIGFDITAISTETLPRPSLTLKNIYKHVGLDYNKKKWETERTVLNLDYDNLYISVRKRNDSLNELLTCFDTIFEEI